MKLRHGDRVTVRTRIKGRERTVVTTVDALDGVSFPQHGYVLVAGFKGVEGPVSVRASDVEPVKGGAT